MVPFYIRSQRRAYPAPNQKSAKVAPAKITSFIDYPFRAVVAFSRQPTGEAGRRFPARIPEKLSQPDCGG